MKSIQPSTNETAFDCPHCGAYTTQSWFATFARDVESEDRVPLLPGEEAKQHLSNNRDIDAETRASLIKWVDRIASGLVTLDPLDKPEFIRRRADNLHLSQCYNCAKIAVWVHERMVFPEFREADQPNQDMAEDIIRDFNEARGIVNDSPRGAAALLRLCIQKLCKQLGEKGKNIDDDIGALVKKGLNPVVQKSLDVVRVIGNEAVHPGTIDLKDDRGTALQLFKLVNAIAEQMITFPKTIGSIYDSLPEGKRQAIDRRDSDK